MPDSILSNSNSPFQLQPTTHYSINWHYVLSTTNANANVKRKLKLTQNTKTASRKLYLCHSVATFICTLSCYCVINRMADLVLDPRIRDWVLVPIVLVMFLVAIFRHNITKLLRTDPKPNIKSAKEAWVLFPCTFFHSPYSIFQTNSSASEKIAHKWQQTPFFFILYEKNALQWQGNWIVQSKHSFFSSGLFATFILNYFKPKEKAAAGPMGLASPMSNPLMDPSNMVDMMKKNMAMVVPQIFLITWVSYFFSGFVLGKKRANTETITNKFALTIHFPSEIAVSLNVKLQRDATKRHRFEHSGCELCVLSVLVFLGPFWSQWVELYRIRWSKL